MLRTCFACNAKPVVSLMLKYIGHLLSHFHPKMLGVYCLGQVKVNLKSNQTLHFNHFLKKPPSIYLCHIWYGGLFQIESTVTCNNFFTKIKVCHYLKCHSLAQQYAAMHTDTVLVTFYCSCLK